MLVPSPGELAPPLRGNPWSATGSPTQASEDVNRRKIETLVPFLYAPGYTVLAKWCTVQHKQVFRLWMPLMCAGKWLLVKMLQRLHTRTCGRQSFRSCWEVSPFCPAACSVLYWSGSCWLFSQSLLSSQGVLGALSRDVTVTGGHGPLHLSR